MFMTPITVINKYVCRIPKHSIRIYKLQFTNRLSDLQIQQFRLTNRNQPYCLSVFRNTNQQNKMIKLLKSELACSKIADFSNAEEILHDGRKI